MVTINYSNRPPIAIDLYQRLKTVDQVESIMNHCHPDKQKDFRRTSADLTDSERNSVGIPCVIRGIRMFVGVASVKFSFSAHRPTGCSGGPITCFILTSSLIGL